MSSKLIPSPARSEGQRRTPRQAQPRKTRSVGSNASSNASGRLTSVLEDYKDRNDSFALVLAGRRSVLTDNTDIPDKPSRKSWWKNLKDNSQNMMEILEDNNVINPNNIMEELDIEVLSQENQNKNYTMDLPEISDGESINSIVLPQRKLLTQKENQAQKKFGEIMGSRDMLTVFNATVTDKTINAGTKQLFQNKRTKPLFPTALLDITPDKTIGDKTTTAEPKGQVRNIFGTRPGKKRKNMFANFIDSESEDEIPDIQPNVFDFPKKSIHLRRGSSQSCGLRETSTASVTTDIDMDEWKYLPSSTMVENQLAAMFEGVDSPVKKAKLSKLSETKESEASNKSKRNKSAAKNTSITTSRSKVISEEKEKEHTLPQNKSLEKQDKSIDKSNGNKSKNKSGLKNKSKVATDEVINESVTNKNSTKQINKSNSSTSKYISLSKSKTIHDNKKDVTMKDNIKTDDRKSSEQNEEANANQLQESKTSNEMNKSQKEIYKSHKNKKDQETSNAELDQSKGRAHKSREIYESREKEVGQEVLDGVEEGNETQEEDQIKEVDRNEEEENANEVDQSQEAEAIDKEVKQSQEIVEESQEIDEDEQANESEDVEQNQENIEVRKEIDEDEQADEREVEQSRNETQEEDQIKEVDRNEEEENASEVDQSQEAEAIDKEVKQSQEIVEESQEIDEDEQANESEDVEQNQENIEVRKEIDEDEQADEREVEQSQENFEATQEKDEDEQADESEEELSHENDEIEDHSDNDAKNESQERDSEQSDNDNFEATQEMDEDEQADESEEELSQENDEIEDHSDNDAQNESQEGDSEQSDNDANLHYESEDMEVDDEIPNKTNEVINLDYDKNDQIENSPNTSHDTTGRNRKKDTSPDVVRLENVNPNISGLRKTSMLNSSNTKLSTRPIRDSIGLSDGINSSEEGSGWDSHRTTRKTIRQTLGKDFSVRKSLRTLVMEKSAKRQTLANQEVASEAPKFPLANSTELPEMSNQMDYDDLQESTHEVSLRTKQMTLEAYMKKIKMETLERRAKLEEEVRNTVETYLANPFKVPAKPLFPRRPLKPINKVQKKTSLKDIPEELVEDMKYKPPKRFQPPNAPWITKRLYKFLETKLEPKYDYKARLRSEKLVENIYQFTKEIRRQKIATKESVDFLKHEMARLNIVKTHHEFYEFFHQFMPREVRIKVIPDVVNKIPLPRGGVFVDIIVAKASQG